MPRAAAVREKPAARLAPASAEKTRRVLGEAVSLAWLCLLISWKPACHMGTTVGSSAETRGRMLTLGGAEEEEEEEEEGMLGGAQGHKGLSSELEKQGGREASQMICARHQ
jgi:hypothetical protein